MFREERGEREERVSLLALLGVGWLWLVVGCPVGRLSGRGAAGWAVCGGRPLPLRAPMRFGRGVRPSSVTCPCCLSRSCPSGFRTLAAVFRLGYLGFLFPCLARLLASPGVASHLSSAGLFLSLCYSQL